MRALWPVLGLLSCLNAWGATGSAAVDIWYARPTGACANNGDGLAYSCASGAGATGAFIGLTNIIKTSTTGVDDGDTLYVCGEHLESFRLLTWAGSASSRITISFDCPEDAGSINRFESLSGATTSGNWTEESSNVWYISVASYTYKDPRRMWLNGTEVPPASVKANLGTSEGMASNVARFWYDSGNSRIYVYSTSNPAGAWTTFRTLNAGAGGCDYTTICATSNASYLDVVSPKLYGGNFASIYLQGTDNIRIYGASNNSSNCVISSSIRGAFITDGTAGSGTGTDTTNSSIKYCTIDFVYPPQFDGINWQWNAGQGDGVHILTGADNNVIQHNSISNFPHAQVYVNAVSGTNTNVGNQIVDNFLDCSLNKHYCRGFAIDGETVGDSANNVFARNWIKNQNIRTQVNGNANYIASNVWTDARQSTVSGSEDDGEYLSFEGYSSLASQDNLIYNNGFSNNTYNYCIDFKNGATSKTGYVVANNVMVACGGTAGSNDNVALNIDASGVGNNTFSNNDIHNSGATPVFYKASGAVSVAAFQSACSGDVCSGNIASDPLLLGGPNPTTTEGFRPTAASPLCGTGIHVADAKYDYSHRRFSLPRDIGAYACVKGSSGGAAVPRPGFAPWGIR